MKKFVTFCLAYYYFLFVLQDVLAYFDKEVLQAFSLSVAKFSQFSLRSVDFFSSFKPGIQYVYVNMNERWRRLKVMYWVCRLMYTNPIYFRTEGLLFTLTFTFSILSYFLSSLRIFFYLESRMSNGISIFVYCWSFKIQCHNCS